MVITITRARSCKLHDNCILHALSHQRCLRLFRVCPSRLAYEKRSSPREHTGLQPQQHPGNLWDNPVRLLCPRRIFLLFLATSDGILRVWESTWKINPKSIQNDAGEVPGGHPEPPWGLPGVGPGRFFRRNWKYTEIWMFLGASQDIPGGPRGPRGTPKIDQESTFWWKKGVSNLVNRFFCLHNAMFNVFCSISLRLFTKINEKTEGKRDVQFHPSACFLNMTTFTKHRILRYESYFFIFLHFVFLQRNINKNTPKFKSHSVLQKTLKSGSRGCVLGPKMVLT